MNASQSIRTNFLAILMIAVLGLFSSAVAGPTPEFSVFGWTKQKVSKGENSQSLNRGNHAPIRALPAAQRPTSYQAVRAPQNPYTQNRPIPAPAPAASVNPNAHSPWGPQAATPAPAPQVARRQTPNRSSSPQIAELRARSHSIAERKYKYVFGGEVPSEGGLDCSGTVQYLLRSMGMQNVPRTSYLQYDWLKDAGTLKTVGMFHSPERAWANLQPGDLVFWGKTWNSGHKVSHVMIYLGQSPTGKKYMFGARGTGKTGLTGAEVDVYELSSNRAASIVGYGRIPGLRR